MTGLSLIAFSSCTKKNTNSSVIEIVAQLENPVSEVKIRRAKEFVWNLGQIQMGLGNYDAVKTGGAASCEIHYRDSSQLELGENTMVIILEHRQTEQATETQVALNLGSLKGHLKPDPVVVRTLLIKTNKAWIRGTSQVPTTFTATVDKNRSVQIKTESGKVQLLAEGVEKEIPEKATITIPASDSDIPVTIEELAQKNETYESLPVATRGNWKTELKQPKIETVTALKSSKPPEVKKSFKILSPKNKATIQANKIKITGEAATQTKIYLKNKAIPIKKDGSFFVELELNPGINLITFQIESKSGMQYETLELLRK